MIPLIFIFIWIFGGAGIAALVCAFLMTVFVLFCAKSLMRRKKSRDRLFCDAQKLAKTASEGALIVKMFGRVRFERERITAANEAYSESGYDFAFRAAAAAAAAAAGAVISVTATEIAAGYGVFTGEITETAAVIIVLWIFAAMLAVGLFGYLTVFGKDSEKKVTKPHGKKAQKTIYGDINENTGRNDLVFSGVSFSYGDREIFGGLSFSVKSGERFAVLGQTGSGKTTLSRLINRELEPDSGIIKLGGVEISEFTKELTEKMLKSLDFIESDRVSEVMNREVIILLDGGVCETGNHNALLVTSKLYRRMYEAEFGVNPYKSLDKGDDFDDWLK
ncbi:MAG: ABC transporter ATP-binding protein/permease [Ruminococcus sp.]|jgi:ATP-binding cassette subfamily B protein|nr:ABC transporter ATP-binding protein/permease [Ruminococcus sp.]